MVKLDGSSLIETLISLVLISILIVLTMQLFGNVFSNKNPEEVLRAEKVLDEYIHSFNHLEDEVISISGYKIIISNKSDLNFSPCKLYEFNITNKNDQSLFIRKKVFCDN